MFFKFFSGAFGILLAYIIVCILAAIAIVGPFFLIFYFILG